jgi:hypothetical protein
MHEQDHPLFDADGPKIIFECLDVIHGAR